jgi:hypothetical protein
MKINIFCEIYINWTHRADMRDYNMLSTSIGRRNNQCHDGLPWKIQSHYCVIWKHQNNEGGISLQFQ